MRTSVWRELAISPSTDEREIRRAYARRLKIVHPEDDPEGFQALRAAFEQALNHARHAAWEADNGWNDDDAVDEGLDAPAAPLGENHAPPPATPSTEASPQDPALVAEMARDRADRDEHQRRCDALSEALRQAAPDSETVLTALVAVFRSPALGALDVHDSTEHWLDQLAAQRGPGFEVLLDDRKASPGVKFADAEVLGMPTTVVVGRGLADGVVEIRDRATREKAEVPADEAVERVLALLGR